MLAVDERWAFKEELQAFTFLNYEDAHAFLENPPQKTYVREGKTPLQAFVEAATILGRTRQECGFR